MTRIIRRLSDTGTSYRALFCDLWGCVHNGKTAWPEAVAALQEFRAGGGRVILVTNSPRPKGPVAEQIAGMGVPRDAWDDIATSGDAAQYALFAGAVGHRVHHIGSTPKDDPFFTDVPPELEALRAEGPAIERVDLDQAEGIVCTSPLNEYDDRPEDYRAAFLYAKARGMKMLCANPDLIVDFGETRLLCAGSLAKFYEELGGEALYFGKPHPPVYDLARRRLAAIDGTLTDRDILCVGDGIGTDILGGEMEGLDTLFLTEGLQAGNFGPAERLDAERLEAFLTAEGRNPTLTTGFLR
ncbi:TIGR01459 family HAD-type hydrolase [Szabonella alba]|uniref:TIGR01459 family HAD-type hydrolase n=1 Tax=Szabonella alba TaxID=2804194 RepID=A0A8K0VB17_9RHOB|nr:TIGR01459 family HAD-type hydrolase [Szabonella alba]MBL4918924.1 TIGR01459 family HAD-type hydrolase [Szabonella alba]